MKKYYWFLTPAVIFPFLLIMAGLYAYTNLFRGPSPTSSFAVIWFMIIIWLFTVGCTVAFFVFCLSKRLPAHGTAKANLIIKILQIPIYCSVIIPIIDAQLDIGTAFLGLIISAPIIFMCINAIMILQTGLIGLAAIIRCKEENVLDTGMSLICGLLQFVPIADFVTAIIAFKKTKGSDN